MTNENHPFAAPQTTIVSQRKTGVRWWLILAIFGVPILIVALGTFIFRIGYTIRENSGRGVMAVEIQKLAKDGNTIDNESTDVLYRSRTSSESQDDWLSLFSLVESPGFKKGCDGIPLLDRSIDNDQPFRAIDASDWEYANACLIFTAKSQDLIEKVRHLAVTPTPTQFPIHFQANETLLPEVQSVRQLALVIFVDSQVAIHLRESNRATQDIVTLYSLANHVDAVPCAVSRLVGIAIRRLALQALQGCIEFDVLQADQLLQLDGVIQNFCEVGDRWHAVISEELGLYLPLFTHPSIAMKSETPIPARGHDAVYYIDLMRRAMDLETENWSAFYISALKLESELEAANKFSIQRTDRILSYVLAPAFGALAAAWINDAQLNRQARLAITIRLHALRANELPTNLDELSSNAAQLRPFGIKPFGYKIENNKAMLWGFELSNSLRETPTSLPSIELIVPGASDKARLVWKIVHSPH
jgi:hypothetical protein